jgi:hypothetical protein
MGFMILIVLAITVMFVHGLRSYTSIVEESQRETTRKQQAAIDQQRKEWEDKLENFLVRMDPLKIPSYDPADSLAEAVMEAVVSSNENEDLFTTTLDLEDELTKFLHPVCNRGARIIIARNSPRYN